MLINFRRDVPKEFENTTLRQIKIHAYLIRQDILRSYWKGDKVQQGPCKWRFKYQDAQETNLGEVEI